jgi:YfiH family protein
MLTAGPLEALPGLRHGFFTREGGVSEGAFASLNCGFGSADDPARVTENRARAMARIGAAPENLATAYQIHSAEVALAEAPWPADGRPRVDALVTRRPGLALGILTADCAPLLLADAGARVVAAVHAGWRGTLAGVAEAALGAMADLGARPRTTVAAIGPAIGRESYEVGPEFPARFLDLDPAYGAFFRPAPRERHWLFDLKGLLVRRLEKAGVGELACLPQDTLAEPERFFSYRRACLEGARDYGRLLSAICLET